MRFKRGMTVLERMRYREQMLAREIEKAYRQAAILHLTPECREAMAVTGQGDQAQELHERCTGEKPLPGSRGCLCQCHDDMRQLPKGVSVGFGFAGGKTVTGLDSSQVGL